MRSPVALSAQSSRTRLVFVRRVRDSYATRPLLRSFTAPVRAFAPTATAPAAGASRTSTIRLGTSGKTLVGCSPNASARSHSSRTRFESNYARSARTGAALSLCVPFHSILLYSLPCCFVCKRHSIARTLDRGSASASFTRT